MQDHQACLRANAKALELVRAATPESVEVPPDPCQASANKLRDERMDLHAQYTECASTHAREVRLATLSKELMESRNWLVVAEKIQEERRRNPEKYAGVDKSSEWGRLAQLEPAHVRASQAALFTEYRSAGGTAVRIEDVTALPNPCVQNLPGPPARPQGPSSITGQRSQTAPAR